MLSIKNAVFYAGIIFSAQQCAYIHAAEASDVVINVASESGLKIIVENAAIAAPYISVVVQAYMIGQEIRTHAFPTEQEQAHAHEVSEKFASLTAENEFRNCLVANKNTSYRADSGRPTACEEIARMFVMLGGKGEVNEMTTAYNKYREQL